MNRKDTYKDGISLLLPEAFPSLLREINDPPKRLFIKGTLPPPDYRYLCVVGSRSYSSYGKEACGRLIEGLAGFPIAIVSGLALGIDGIAHEAALHNNLKTIALPGSGLDESVLYPRAHLGLAREIVSSGGALLSEFAPDDLALPWHFPKRNRLMAGMCDAVLIIEAGEKSGTLITARLGMEYGRDVLAVPAPIFSPHGGGSNQLLRDGAQLVTSSNDILEALHITPHQTEEVVQTPLFLSPDEQILFDLLAIPLSRDDLMRASLLGTVRAQCALSSLEVQEIVRERAGMIERVRHKNSEIKSRHTPLR